MKSKTLVIGAAALSVWTGAAEEKVLDWSKAQFLSVAAARVKGVKARYVCPYGTIASEWSINEKGEDSYRFTIPEGTTATVVIPNGRNFELGPGTYAIPEEE